MDILYKRLTSYNVAFAIIVTAFFYTSSALAQSNEWGADGCEGVEEECITVTGERLTCPELALCFDGDGNQIFTRKAYTPRIVPDAAPEDTFANCMNLFNPTGWGAGDRNPVCDLLAQLHMEWTLTNGLPNCNKYIKFGAEQISYASLVAGAYEFVQARPNLVEYIKNLDLLEESVPNSADAKVARAELIKTVAKGASRVAGFMVALEIAGTAVDFYCQIAENDPA